MNMHSSARIHPSRHLINRVDLFLDDADEDSEFVDIGDLDFIKPRTDLDVDGRPISYSPLDTHW